MKDPQWSTLHWGVLHGGVLQWRSPPTNPRLPAKRKMTTEVVHGESGPQEPASLQSVADPSKASISANDIGRGHMHNATSNLHHPNLSKTSAMLLKTTTSVLNMRLRSGRCFATLYGGPHYQQVGRSVQVVLISLSRRNSECSTTMSLFRPFITPRDRRGAMNGTVVRAAAPPRIARDEHTRRGRFQLKEVPHRATLRRPLQREPPPKSQRWKRPDTS